VQLSITPIFFLLVAIFSLAAGFFAKRLNKYVVSFRNSCAQPACSDLAGKLHYVERCQGRILLGNVTMPYSTGSEFDLQLAIMILCFASMPLLVLIGARQGAAFVGHDKGYMAYIWAAAGGIIGPSYLLFKTNYYPTHNLFFYGQFSLEFAYGAPSKTIFKKPWASFRCLLCCS